MRLDTKYLKNFSSVIGCDEAGRGPLAGPVVGCAVKVDRENKGLFRRLKALGVCDSKKMSASARSKVLASLDIRLEALEIGRAYQKELGKWNYSFVLGELGPADIDRLNILQASLSCMRSAALKLLPDEECAVLIDGNKVFSLSDFSELSDQKVSGGMPFVEPVVKGDQKLLCIGLASIIAKEFRDEKMRQLEAIYPGYGFASHAGYPTAAHREAIARLGVSPAHRISFKGVKEHVDSFQANIQIPKG